MKYNQKYPLKHLSIRVPWHDRGWDGSICDNPCNNEACLTLKNCSLNRNDEQETENSGKYIHELESQELYPTCVGERATFMANFEFSVSKGHPYSKNPFTGEPSESHGHIENTNLRYPPFSASCVPFAWMRKEGAEDKSQLMDLDYNTSREPNLNFKDNWIQQYDNQKEILDCFFEHFQDNTSLCFIYAKRVPFVESNERVLIGVGRIKHISDGLEYNYKSKTGLRSMLWEHMVTHTIRPGFDEGFILPYKEILEYAKDNSTINPETLAVLVPDEKRYEFSYASEHVSNDTALTILSLCIEVMQKITEMGKIGKWEKQILWCHDRISELEKLRGDYPGLGAALCAFGISKGHFVAKAVLDYCNEDDNPWNFVDLMFENPDKILPDYLQKEITNTLAKTYRRLKEKKPKRLALLKLLSRFDLNIDQAKMLYVPEEREKYSLTLTDSDIIDNPYLIYEQTRLIPDLSVDLSTIDIGLYSNKSKTAESQEEVKFDDPFDYRRVMAITFKELVKAADKGHTLLPRKLLVNIIRELPLTPKCEITGDIYEVVEEDFGDTIWTIDMKDDKPAYKLGYLRDMSELIYDKIVKRQKGIRHNINVDWRSLVDKRISNGDDFISDSEEKARMEKAFVLEELANSRISVLIGSAGTGKTTVLSILCEVNQIKDGRILLLAPTGKARVRLEELAAEHGNKAYTLAQFLGKYGRYDYWKQIYQISEDDRCGIYETVIVDESSMLTEEMLAALLDSLEGVKRIILAGDFRQLPPIGPGRPFVDIVNFLSSENLQNKYPRITNNYCELTIKCRQGGSDRDDLQLAEFFSGNSLPPGEDLIISKLISGFNSDYLRIAEWDEIEDFSKLFEKVLVEELNLKDINDLTGFNLALGANPNGYFNREEAVKNIENWQILSPIRGREIGVHAINRLIHKLYRTRQINSKTKKLPTPFGNEQLVYGDKIINNRNQGRKAWPKDGLNYIANGEIGICIGRWQRKGDTKRPTELEIEFSSQRGYFYNFKAKDFSEEGDNSLELAYTITIHKSQGSQYKKVFLIIPKNCFLLSTEMLYTALTRQVDKVILLCQGSSRGLIEYSSIKYSDTLSRITDLFEPPELVNIDNKFLELNLIHKASDNTLLRSKSEVIIYEQLLKNKFKPSYERELEINDVVKFPDFTIVDDDRGITFYWEHCGMLYEKAYKERWEKKKKWYLENNILLIDAKEKSDKVLVISEDSVEGGISVPDINEVISNIKNY